MFQRQRKRVAQKLQNPRLLRISFHTIRHWKATMEYQRTKDILYVMRLLGHKSIKNTLIYTQLVEFEENTDQYISKVATTVDEARELIEAGFEYVCDMDGVKIFRKKSNHVRLKCTRDEKVCGFIPWSRGWDLNPRKAGLQPAA